MAHWGYVVVNRGDVLAHCWKCDGSLLGMLWHNVGNAVAHFCSSGGAW